MRDTIFMLRAGTFKTLKYPPRHLSDASNTDYVIIIIITKAVCGVLLSRRNFESLTCSTEDAEHSRANTVNKGER